MSKWVKLMVEDHVNIARGVLTLVSGQASLSDYTSPQYSTSGYKTTPWRDLSVTTKINDMWGKCNVKKKHSKKTLNIKYKAF